jgi:glycosyltransferase involved in cell wall biosynthesis
MTNKPACLLTLPWSLQNPGGVNEIVKSLIRHMLADGEPMPVVLVVNVSEHSEEWDRAQPYPTIYTELGIPFYGSSRVRSCVSFLIRLPRRLLRLRGIFREHNVRMVNVHFPNLADLHYAVLRGLGLFRGGFQLSFHLSDARAAAETRGLERWLWRRLLRSADVLITDSDDMHPDLLAVEPACRPKLLTVHNGADLEFCSSRPSERDRFPAELEGKPVILSVGNFEVRKGHHILMRAFRQVLDRFPEAGLVMVGGPQPYLSELRRLHTELGLEGRAFLIENVPHELIPAYLSRSRLFALATQAEAFSLSILEAGAAGLPIVSTRARGVVEQLKDGVTAKLVKVDDVDGLAQALLELLENPAEADRLAKNFRTEIQSSLTWDHHYVAYREVYRRSLRP